MNPTPQQRRDIACELRLRGKLFRQIGEAMGVCEVRAREIYARAREIKLGRHHWTDQFGVRTQNVLWNAGLNTVEEVRDAIQSGALSPHRWVRGTNGKGWVELGVPNYGIKSHQELCEFLGVKV